MLDTDCSPTAPAFPLSLPFPFKFPSRALSFWRGEDTDEPLLVWGLGGSDAVRVRAMISFSLLVRFGLTPGSVGETCWTSCEEEKRLNDLEKAAVVLLIASVGS